MVCLLFLVTAAPSRAMGQTDGAPEAPSASSPSPPATSLPQPFAAPGDPFPLLFGQPIDVSRTPPEFTAPAPAERDFALVRTPNMFGDAFFRGGQLQAVGDFSGLTPGSGVVILSGDVPLAGGARRLKVSENNKALPMDRVYFTYNHFHNAFAAAASISDPAGSLAAAEETALDRYTLGLEKTWGCGCWSVELRVPLTSELDFEASLEDPLGFNNAAASLGGGSMGNLGVVLKRLLHRGRYGAISAGIAVEAPTGSDAAARAGGTRYEFENEAVHISPYLGALAANDSPLFWHAFVQADFAASGNTVRFGDADGPLLGGYGELDPPPLFYADLSVGHWLRRRNSAPLVTGVAALLEMHYTAVLDGDETVIGMRTPAADPETLLWSYSELEDAMNFTAGLHLELGRRTTLRTAGVFPLLGGDQRPFDSEVVVQLNRYY